MNECTMQVEKKPDAANGLAGCENEFEQLAWIKVGKRENCKWMQDTILNEWGVCQNCQNR